MSKCDIRPEFECRKTLNEKRKAKNEKRISKNEKRKIRYSVQVRMSKKDFECQNSIFGPNSNVKIGFRMSKCDIWPEIECRKTKNEKRKTKNKKRKIRMSKLNFECHNSIFGPNSNVNIGF